MRISIITPWTGDTAAALLPDYASATRGADVVTVDNACAPTTAEALRRFHEVPPTSDMDQAEGTSGCNVDCGTYLRSDVNLGFAGGNNAGYARAKGDVIVFLNNDIAGDPYWLNIVAETVKDGALYGPKLAYQTVYAMSLPYLEGWCIAATRKTWERLKLEGQDGPWDAASYPGPYWEDNDLCFRALSRPLTSRASTTVETTTNLHHKGEQITEPAAGIDLVPMHVDLHHKGGRTMGPAAKYGDVYETNRATFAEKVRVEWEKAVGK